MTSNLTPDGQFNDFKQGSLNDSWLFIEYKNVSFYSNK